LPNELKEWDRVRKNVIEKNLGKDCQEYDSWKDVWDKYFPSGVVSKLSSRMDIKKAKLYVRECFQAFYCRNAPFYVEKSFGLGIFAKKHLSVSVKGKIRDFGGLIMGHCTKSSQSLLLALHRRGFDSFYSKEGQDESVASRKRKQSILAGPLSLVNHSDGSANSKFIHGVRNQINTLGKAWLRIDDDLEEDEEVLVDYGKDYWEVWSDCEGSNCFLCYKRKKKEPSRTKVEPEKQNKRRKKKE
jgi:hypothetical protein